MAYNGLLAFFTMRGICIGGGNISLMIDDVLVADACVKSTMSVHHDAEKEDREDCWN